VNMDSTYLIFSTQKGRIKVKREALADNLAAKLEKSENWEKPTHVLIPFSAIEKRQGQL
jgi:hypothetical protein